MFFLFFLNLTRLPWRGPLNLEYVFECNYTSTRAALKTEEKTKSRFSLKTIPTFYRMWLFIRDNPSAPPSHSAGLARHSSIVNVSVFLSLPLYHHLTPLSVLIVFFIVFPSFRLSEVSQGRRRLVTTFVWSHLMCSFGKCCERGSRVATDASKED